MSDTRWNQHQIAGIDEHRLQVSNLNSAASFGYQVTFKNPIKAVPVGIPSRLDPRTRNRYILVIVSVTDFLDVATFLEPVFPSRLAMDDSGRHGFRDFDRNGVFAIVAVRAGKAPSAASFNGEYPA